VLLFYSFFNLGATWGVWLTPRPRYFTPGEDSRYPLCRRLGGPQGRSGRVQKISPASVFDPRIVQPLASRHTDWTLLWLLGTQKAKLQAYTLFFSECAKTPHFSPTRGFKQAAGARMCHKTVIRL
jgi:hypothetical protein